VAMELDAEGLRKLFLAGAQNLEKNRDWINELNVFPVPDGDTGINMTMTLQSAVREVMDLQEVTMENLARAISSGSLRGARGNSGVILSQLIRGFTRELKGETVLTGKVAARCMAKATETAYKAVMKPKEGTILTVARGLSSRAEELAETEMDAETFLTELIVYGDEVLARTPEMLPVLKQAGVVDSGGQGLMQFMKGIQKCLTGEVGIEAEHVCVSPASRLSEMVIEDDLDNITFGYCTEFLVMLEKPYTEADELDFKAYLEGLGDCVVVVSDEDVIKVHVHTNDPGLAIQKGLTYGSLTAMKIDNMREEHEEKLRREAASKQSSEVRDSAQAQVTDRMCEKTYGFVAISVGSGLDDVFRSLNVDAVIEGGQTMNPCTEDILEAVSRVKAENVFILPNNSNIILAAEQAASLIEDRRIFVLPTKSVPQGITAMVNFLPDKTPEENFRQMQDSLDTVKTGQVTYAVRDTMIEDQQIHENDYMGLGDHSALLAVGTDLERVTLDMIERMVDEDSAVISVYYGDSVTEEQAEALSEKLEEFYEECDIQVLRGGQPVYYYIASVE